MYNEKYGRVDKVQRVNLEGSQPDKKIESGKKRIQVKGWNRRIPEIKGENMSVEKDLKAMKDQVIGKAKENIGKAVDNPDLELEGKLQKAKGDLNKEANKVIKDAKEKKDEVVRKVNKKLDDLSK